MVWKRDNNLSIKKKRNRLFHIVALFEPSGSTAKQTRGDHAKRLVKLLSRRTLRRYFHAKKTYKRIEFGTNNLLKQHLKKTMEC